MKQITLVTLMLLSVFLACTKNSTSENTDLISYVNPFVGTGGHGHTYPGATMPFGMMQLSPDTWIPVLGPLTGGLLAGLAYSFLI